MSSKGSSRWQSAMSFPLGSSGERRQRPELVCEFCRCVFDTHDRSQEENRREKTTVFLSFFFFSSLSCFRDFRSLLSPLLRIFAPVEVEEKSNSEQEEKRRQLDEDVAEADQKERKKGRRVRFNALMARVSYGEANQQELFNVIQYRGDTFFFLSLFSRQIE